MSDNFIPILFKVLFGFVILNIIINFILLVIKKKRMYQLLSIFWPSVLGTFVLQSFFQTDQFNIIMAYSATVIPMTLVAMIGFEAVGRDFPLKRYILLFASAYPVFYLFHHLGLGFTASALPFAITTAAPLLHASVVLLFLKRKGSTKLQKLLGGIFIIWAIHCFNFAFFRMDSGTQLWGWLMAYALYDTLAILLPSIALEEANQTEQVRLQTLVNEKTSELNKSLKENETLIKILLHDISNPLTVMKWYMSVLKPEKVEEQNILEKVKKSLSATENIVKKVKDLYANKKMTQKRDPISLEECLQEVSFIFTEPMNKKNISLKFDNQLSDNTKILADRTSFTHSVLSNLISNGLKFSEPNSELEVTAREQDNQIVVEIRDFGPGISKDVLNSLTNEEIPMSSDGTIGEKGTGFGLSIVKSFVSSYGGQIEFESNPALLNPNSHGTNVRITLDKA
jgi:signal transduction histidine kinase